MTEEKKINCLFILGMYKSGVSTLGKYLNWIGSFSRIDSQSEGRLNDHAKFPVVSDVERLHDVFLKDLGCKWDTVEHLPEFLNETQAIESAGKRIQKVVDERNKNNGVFVIADPQLCRFMSLWLHVLEENNLNPGFVHIIRHPWEVAQSLKNGRGVTFQKSQLLWFRLNMDAIDIYKNRPSLIFSYDQFLTSPRSVLSDIAKTYNTAFPETVQIAIDRVLRETPVDYKKNVKKSIGKTIVSPSNVSSLAWFNVQTYNKIIDVKFIPQEAIVSSDLDVGFYRSWYPDLSGVTDSELILHWQKHGVQQGRFSCLKRALSAENLKIEDIPEKFDPKIYIQLNEDKIPAGIDDEYRATYHYLIKGKKEGLQYHFDHNFYNTFYKDLHHLTDFDSAFNHWRKWGKKAGRAGNFDEYLIKEKLNVGDLPKRFNPRSYIMLNKERLPAEIDDNYRAIWHYLAKGKKQGLRYYFDDIFYREFYKDLGHLDDFDSAINHWIKWGKSEGRLINLSEYLKDIGLESRIHDFSLNVEKTNKLNPSIQYDSVIKAIKDAVNQESFCPIRFFKDDLLNSEFYYELCLNSERQNNLGKAEKYYKVSRSFGEQYYPKEHLGNLSLDPIFDYEFVADQLNCPKENAFVEFIKQIGDDPFLSPHPLFDGDFYKIQLDFNGLNIKQPLIIHYMSEGWKRGFDPHPLFDTDYYRNCLQISSFEICPLKHYLLNSGNYISDPSPFIDEKYYINCRLEKNYKIYKDNCLHDLVVRKEWCPFHKEVTRQSIGQIVSDVPITKMVDRDRNVTVNDFIEIIRDIRSWNFKSYSPEHTTKRQDFSEGINISVIILNYNNIVHTILSTFCAYKALKKLSYEIIVVDNASGFFRYNQTAKYINPIPNCRIVRLERNRFFGEGNNIAFDFAKGRYISLVNNDAYVSESTFTKMLSIFKKDHSVGVVGPIFVLPDYTFQEVGGRVSSCGQTLQIGKFKKVTKSLVESLEKLPVRRKYVDYCSAACCTIDRKALEKVGGFDYIYEPFYYEDTDLCSRIRCAGFNIYIDYDTQVLHFENTSTTPFLGDNFNELVAENNRKFSNRWFGKLELVDELGMETPRIQLFASKQKSDTVIAEKPIAFVYSPFSLNAGGGEKFILTLSEALTDKYDTTILFNEIYSTHRLKMVAEDLGVSASNLSILTLDEAIKKNRPDLFVAMGNEIVPTVPAIGKSNFFHCQFPFPLGHIKRPEGLSTLLDYEGFIVNSEFTKREIKRQLQTYGLPSLPIHVVYPPCWNSNVDVKIETCLNSKTSKTSKALKEFSIVNVGRFFRHGHTKRQDIVLDIIEGLQLSQEGRDWGIKGTLLGGLSNSDKDYYDNLAVRASTMGVKIASNVERSEIDAAYRDADVYIHATGFGRYEGFSAQELEHFGITVVEAMTNGTIPLVYNGGGPLEIVQKVGVGETYTTVQEAIDKVWKIVALSENDRRLMIEKMVNKCTIFSVDAFNEKIKNLLY